jgi:hypothetical protein
MQARLLALILTVPRSQWDELIDGIKKIAAGLCVYSGPGVYRLRESPTSERTALYHVDDVIEHPSGPFIMCRSTDPEIRLPISFQGPFEAWAVERVYAEGGAS